MITASRLRIVIAWALYCFLPVTALPALFNQTAEANVANRNSTNALLPPYPYPSGSYEWVDGFKGKQWHYKIDYYRYPTVSSRYAQEFLEAAIQSLEDRVSDSVPLT